MNLALDWIWVDGRWQAQAGLGQELHVYHTACGWAARLLHNKEVIRKGFPYNGAPEAKQAAERMALKAGWDIKAP